MLLGLGALAAVSAPDSTPAPSQVEFNRDIRPILSDHCFQCHGPDQAKRKAKLRLDTEEGAFANLGGTRAIVPGKLEDSELFRRITATDDEEKMPPSHTGRRLTREQTELIRQWILQGARWQKHWSLLSPSCPDPPLVRNSQGVPSSWPRNPIDQFVLDRLTREGLKPSPEADRATLIRRVTLDLTGLPPTIAEVDAFLADTAPDAYERLVDRLLASPRYGERMAVRWLDAARYADTNGYQSDGERFMWRWRDWVIDAFNHNLPFDRFTIEQLAGDLLPQPTLEQRIATGFNRNHRGNGEGGIIPEEYAVEYVADRVETTATVWLGLTMGCARCHDHKYDAVTQKDFYRVFAFFNNVAEKGRANKYGNSPPLIMAPTRQQQEVLRKLEQQLAAAEAAWNKFKPELLASQAAWEKTLPPGDAAAGDLSEDLVAHFSFDETEQSTAADRPFVQSPGRIGNAAGFDGQTFFNGGNVGDFGFYDKFTLAAWVYPQGNQGGIVLSRMADVDQGDGYALALKGDKIQLNLVKRWLDDALRVETATGIPPDRWTHVLVTYDGSRVADGVRIYLDGQPAKLKVMLDELNQSFATKEPLRIGGGGGPEGRFHGRVDEVRIYKGVLTAEEAALVATPETVAAILRMPEAARTPGQRIKLQRYFLEKHAPASVRDAWSRVRSLRKQRDQFVETLPTVMVMEEMPTPRDSFVLIRGQYDRPGEKVTPGIPASLVPAPGTVGGREPRNRLDLARWLVDPANPLTARVAVNRCWQMFFGVGLVKTSEDFGSQGEWPSHPELLDWLACEFMGKAAGWDLKRLHRLIVTSAAYRQSSRVTPQALERDPENRLIARGPRLRLSAEMVRDQALAASGLLVEHLGGPSVRPYQPPGLWKELTGTEDYEQDHGKDLYRRSLYTFWKRTVAPPAMVAFDASGRETCVVRETRTNTPLQALTLMNDVTYVEAARVLAQRALKEGGKTAEERITFMFRVVTARPPGPAELRLLAAGLQRHMDEYRKDRAAALKLVAVGESPREEQLDPSELAAYTAIASMILNLDETITRE